MRARGARARAAARSADRGGAARGAAGGERGAVCGAKDLLRDAALQGEGEALPPEGGEAPGGPRGVLRLGREAEGAVHRILDFIVSSVTMKSPKSQPDEPRPFMVTEYTHTN